MADMTDDRALKEIGFRVNFESLYTLSIVFSKYYFSSSSPVKFAVK
jgi:hypothetical protein